MKAKIFILLLAIVLTACAPATALTPTAVLPTFTPTPTATFAIPTPSLIPTQPPVPVLTPDAVQVERWREYQTELANALFVYNPSFPIWGYGPDVSTNALCEWDILRQRGQEVYVWATCAPSPDSPLKGNSAVIRQNPTVIYLESDGAIQKVSVAIEELSRLVAPHLIYDLHLFPIDVQEMLCLYYFVNVPQCGEIRPVYPDYTHSRQSILVSHLDYRKTHPEEPPLIVLSATPTATPSP